MNKITKRGIFGALAGFPIIGYAYADPTGTNTALGPAATAILGQIPGINTSAIAAVGNIGEYTTANLDQSAALSLSSSAVATTIASVALSPGDWNVWGSVTMYATNSGTAAKYMTVAVSNASNTMPNFTSGSISQMAWGTAGATGIQTTCIPITPSQWISSTAQTAFLVAAISFVNNTVGGFGVLQARRAR